MRTILRPVLVLALLLAPTACASGGGGEDASFFRADMGRLLEGPLTRAQARFWPEYRVPVFREIRDSQRIGWESEWMPRDPTPAERAAGVVAARNQVIMRGRRLEQGMDLTAGSQVYRVTFEVFNQVQTELQPDWAAAPIPDEVVARYRELLSDMELELRTGVRR